MEFPDGSGLKIVVQKDPEAIMPGNSGRKDTHNSHLEPGFRENWYDEGRKKGLVGQ
jgi:hypothetical protein